MIRKPRVGFVPFGYPDYPQNLVTDFIRKAQEEIESLDIEVFPAKPVIDYEDHRKAIEDIRGKEIDFILALVVSWVEPPNVIAALKPFFDKPILLWGMTTFEHEGWRKHIGGMAGACVIRETLEEMGVNLKFVYGMPGSKEVNNKIKKFSNQTRAISLLTESRICMIGYASMGMYTATFDQVSVRRQLGPEIEHLDTYMLIKEMEDINKKEREKIERIIEKNKDRWTVEAGISLKEYIPSMKMYLALKKIIEKKGYHAVTIKCHYELSKNYGVTACLALSLLGDELVCSCEADIPLVVTQLMLHYLSEGKTVGYGDIHDIKDSRVLIGACGYAPFSFALNDRPKISKWGAGEGVGATFTGLLNSSPYKEGKVTIARLSAIGDRYRMHIATGKSLGDVGKVCELDCPPYPGSEIEIDGDPNHFGEHVMSQHYAIVFAEAKEELIELCKMLGIETIITE